MRKTQGAELLVDKVYESLKRDAVEGRLLPEQIVVEGEIAERFGVSKGPVREALKRLVLVGYVHSLPRVGYIVNGIKISDIDDIFSLRIAIEPMAVRLAMGRMSADDLDRLDQLAAGEVAARDAPIPERGHALAGANYDFHGEIARLSGNPRLERIVRGLIEELERVIHLLALNLDDVPDDHPDLVRIIRSGDIEQAATTMRDQLISNREAMRAAAVATTVTGRLGFNVLTGPGDGRGVSARRGPSADAKRPSS